MEDEKKITDWINYRQLKKDEVIKEDDEVYAYLSEIFSNLQSIPKIKEIPLRANGINNRTSKFESKIEFLKKLLSSTSCS